MLDFGDDVLATTKSANRGLKGVNVGGAAYETLSEEVDVLLDCPLNVVEVLGVNGSIATSIPSG